MRVEKIGESEEGRLGLKTGCSLSGIERCKICGPYVLEWLYGRVLCIPERLQP